MSSHDSTDDSADPSAKADRLEVHNASTDESLAGAGACAQIHLATGRVCTLAHNHSGSCEFVTANPH
jgi:hypothetical protein